MKRLHLFEWEDQSWLPKVFRDFITDHLHFVLTDGALFTPVVPLIQRMLADSGMNRVVDLCSGAGGPYPELAEQISQGLAEPVEVTLTDLYPNETAAAGIEAAGNTRVEYRRQSTNVLNVPEELDGLRTLFTSMHHFRPEMIRTIFEDAATKGQPIAAFEVLTRNLDLVLKVPAFNVLSSYLITHKVGRLTLSRVLWTYLAPVAPLIYAWDGMVSCLRSYRPSELGEITGPLSNNRYKFEVGQLEGRSKLGPYVITYVLGTPSRTPRQGSHWKQSVDDGAQSSPEPISLTNDAG